MILRPRSEPFQTAAPDHTLTRRIEGSGANHASSTRMERFRIGPHGGHVPAELSGTDALAEQAETLFHETARRLRAMGRTWSHVAHTTVWLNADRLSEYSEVRRLRGEMIGGPPPVGTGLLVIPDGSQPAITIEFTVAPEPCTPLDVGWAWYANRSMTAVMLSGSWAFVSGLAAVDPATGHLVHAGDAERQRRFCYAKLESAVDAIRSHTGMAVLWPSTIEHWTVAPSPMQHGRGTVRISRCAGLFRAGLIVEVEARPIALTPGVVGR